MKKFLSILFSIVFAIALFLTLVLSIVRFNFSFSTISDLASQLLSPTAKTSSIQNSNSGLFYPEDKIIIYTDYQDDFDLSEIDLSNIDLQNMDINEIVQQYLDAADLDVEPEFVAEILASPEVTQAVEKYSTEIINYMTGASEELNIDPAEITKVINVSIDKYEAATGEKFDRTGLDEAVASTVQEAVPEITTTLDTVKEENKEVFESIKIVQDILSPKFFALCIGVCVILALIIFLINMNVFALFRYISIPGIVVGLIFFISGLVCTSFLPDVLSSVITEFALPSNLYEVIWSLIAIFIAQFKTYGVISTLVGVALLSLGLTLGKSKK